MIMTSQRWTSSRVAETMTSIVVLIRNMVAMIAMRGVLVSRAGEATFLVIREDVFRLESVIGVLVAAVMNRGSLTSLVDEISEITRA